MTGSAPGRSFESATGSLNAPAATPALVLFERPGATQPARAKARAKARAGTRARMGARTGRVIDKGSCGSLVGRAGRGGRAPLRVLEPSRHAADPQHDEDRDEGHEERVPHEREHGARVVGRGVVAL